MIKHKEPLYTRGGIKVYAYDTVDCLDSDEAIAGYLSISLTEDYEPDSFLAAIADALRAKGLNTPESLKKIAEEMQPPVDPAARTKAKAAKKSPARKTTGRKTVARKSASHPRPRKQRAVAVA